MTKSPSLPDVVGEVYKLLDPLDPADRQKVIKSALTLLGEEVGDGTVATASRMFPSDESELGSKATRWISQNGIVASVIDEIFHKEGDKVEVIVSDVPGQGKKTKTQNCYLISGIRSLLESDDPKFSEAEAISLCKHMGCYDQPNHAKTRNDFGNIVAGSKSSGFTLRHLVCALLPN